MWLIKKRSSLEFDYVVRIPRIYGFQMKVKAVAFQWKEKFLLELLANFFVYFCIVNEN